MAIDDYIFHTNWFQTNDVLVDANCGWSCVHEKHCLL